MPKKINKSIDRLFTEYILKEVDKTFIVKRKHKYGNEYCLKMFKYMLNQINQWSSLALLNDYEGLSQFHYKYLNQVFNKWSSNDIFSKAYTNLLQNEYFKLKLMLESVGIIIQFLTLWFLHRLPIYMA